MTTTLAEEAIRFLDTLYARGACSEENTRLYGRCRAAIDALAALSQPDEARAPTPDQYRRAHLYLRQREADLGAGELDELLAIFGLVPAMSKEQP